MFLYFLRKFRKFQKMPSGRKQVVLAPLRGQFADGTTHEHAMNAVRPFDACKRRLDKGDVGGHASVTRQQPLSVSAQKRRGCA